MMWAWLAMMIVYLGGNGYLYWRFLQTIVWMPLGMRITLSIIFWIAAIALFLSFGLRDSSLPSAVTQGLFKVGAVWMVFLLYMVLATALFDIVGHFVPSMKHSLLYALAVTIPLLIYGYVNYRMPRAEHITIDIDKPIDSDSYRIVAISDVHLGYGTGSKELARYIEMINSHNPDVVVIVGDLIDNSITPVIEGDMLAEFRHIRARDGIYMVPGNHEYISNIERCEEHIAASPVVLLRDSIVTLPSGIQLVGRDDRFNHRRMPLDTLVARADSSRPIIVLDHQPYDIAASDKLGVDIHLSGHTHHGQIWPLSWIVDAMYDQSHGYRKWENTHAYVSSGLSLWGPPFRIGTHSDMAVIDIE